ncbi:MAG: PASTA domain-containing protein [Clostridiales bacterium]|nr:PASTA domain-containing protein [Clostridiales bacterium]
MASYENGGKTPRTPNRMMLRRTLFLLIVCGIVAFIVLALRLYKLQVIDHDYYENLALEQQIRQTAIKADRGTIYDCNGKVLAMSADVDTIYISPAEIVMYQEDPSLIASGLSEILGLDYQKIYEKTQNTKSWYQTVAIKVDETLADQVRAFKKQYGLNGVKIEADTKRYYPYSSLAAHVIGFVGTDNSGLSGIEMKYNNELTGTTGRIVRAKNNVGTDLLFTKFEDYYDAENGNSVVLSIDSTIQYYVEKHLQQAIADYDIRNGAAAIVMDVKTGGILAMASLGSYDLNNYQKVSDAAQEKIDAAETPEQAAELLSYYQQRQWRNKALSDTYEPGSTFKIITLAMALEENVATINDHFYCGGYIEVTGDRPGQGRNCWKKTGHGDQTLTQAVQHSCNCAFITIGQRVGAETFYKYCEAFGLLTLTDNKDATPSAMTGIDLSGESGSIWWSQNVFYNPQNKTQLAAASFGQTFTITPLQLITAVSACVNGGSLMQPYLVSEIVADDGTVLSRHEPVVVRRVISEQTSAEVREILEKVVGDPVDGTGKNAYVAGYRIGGKTGTSEKVAQDVAGGAKEYIVSFIGVAPADDPQIAVLVLLDTPSNETGIYISGGQMGAPTVGHMMADILPYLGVEANYTDTEKANMDKTVPNLTGMTVEQAQAALTNAGLLSRVVGSGSTVTAQLPLQNSVVAANTQVILYADAEPSADLEQMIDLTNLTYANARDRLGYYGLFIRAEGSVTKPESQLVSAQSIPVGTEVEHGTVVYVSLTTTDSSMLGRY